MGFSYLVRQPHLFGQNKPFRFELLAITFIIVLKFQILINSNLQLLAF